SSELGRRIAGHLPRDTEQLAQVALLQLETLGELEKDFLVAVPFRVEPVGLGLRAILARDHRARSLTLLFEPTLEACGTIPRLTLLRGDVVAHQIRQLGNGFRNGRRR